MVEIEDKNYSELDKEKSFTEFCELVVKTTDENGNTTEEEKEGVQIKGKDVIYLNTPLILPSKDTPLLTKAPDIVGAINELFQDGGEGGDWQPPDIPEPEDYEIYLLIEVVDVSDRYTSKLEIRMSYPETGQSGYGPMSIDWGDGTIEAWTEVIHTYPDYPDYYDWFDLTHNYAEVGQYLVKISATEHSCFLQWTNPRGGMQYSKILCAKLGSKIIVNADNKNYTAAAFLQQSRLQYVKMSGKGGLPRETLYGCFALKRIDIAVPPQEINPSQFSKCVNLEEFDFSKVNQIPEDALGNAGFKSLYLPNCVSIGKNSVQYCLRLSKVYAPNCKFVDDYAFSNCYNLQEIVVADDCVFGNNCFQNCYSLFPRPDGSVD